MKRKRTSLSSRKKKPISTATVDEDSEQSDKDERLSDQIEKPSEEIPSGSNDTREHSSTNALTVVLKRKPTVHSSTSKAIVYNVVSYNIDCFPNHVKHVLRYKHDMKKQTTSVSRTMKPDGLSAGTDIFLSSDEDEPLTTISSNKVKSLPVNKFVLEERLVL